MSINFIQSGADMFKHITNGTSVVPRTFTPNTHTFYKGISAASDVLTFDDHYLVQVEIPGVNPEKDIDILLENNTLIIKAEKQQETFQNKYTLSRYERAFGTVLRTFHLPEDTNSEVSADYEYGILKIRLGRKEDKRPKSIKVNNVKK